MSRLDDLIQQLCPNGVEYNKVKNVYKRLRGTSITAAEMKKIATPDGEIKIFAGGKTVINAKAQDISGNNIIRVPAVLVQSRGIIDVVYYEKPFTFKNEMWAYTATERISVRFLFYVLKNNILALRKAASGMGSLPQISLPVTEELLIPVPPLPVQEEIVRILDKFTALEAELEAELEARRKQYEFYRDQLLTFGDEVEWKPLGEIFDTRNGYTPSKSQEEYWLNGTIPWFRMEDIRLHGRVLADSIQHVTPCAIKGGKLFPAYSIILGTTATIGEHALVTIECLSNQQMTNLAIKEEYSKFLNIKFFFYYCFILGEWCKKNINAGNFALLDVSKLKKRLIPIPPLAEQERIVAILDKFDALVNDISSGLPAELEMRRKQYEYYRDRLLTFPKKKA